MSFLVVQANWTMNLDRLEQGAIVQVFPREDEPGAHLFFLELAHEAASIPAMKHYQADACQRLTDLANNWFSSSETQGRINTSFFYGECRIIRTEQDIDTRILQLAQERKSYHGGHLFRQQQQPTTMPQPQVVSLPQHLFAPRVPGC